MTDYLIADRYASALSAALPDDSHLESALASLQQISDLFDEHHELHSCLANPAIEVHLREQVLDEVLRRLGAEQTVMRLVHQLMERDRMQVLAETVTRFEEIVDARLNRVAARITTSKALSPAEAERLKGKLSQHAGKAVRLKCSVDPEIIGGVVARIGWQVIDDSVRTRLARLKDALIAEDVKPYEDSGD
jgi:F-type H+-transporting ATPase subunit delta